MRRRFLSLLVLLCTLLFGCAPEGDPFDVLRGGYEAEVEGELYGMAFGARVEVLAVAQGTLPITVTFYAPDALCGTSLVRGADGAVCLMHGDTVLPTNGAAFCDLLAVFEPLLSVVDIRLNEEGRSVVWGEDGCVEFLPDGTPYRAERDGVAIKFVRFVA